jgi:hypothetical protein
MKQKLFFQIISVLLAAKAVFGILYIFMGWKASIAGWVMPMWLMVVAILVDAYLSYLACKFSKKK